MSDILTRRRVSLAMLAALVSLFAAIFATPASAEPQVGDVSATKGYCWSDHIVSELYNNSNYAVTVKVPDGDDADEALDDEPVKCDYDWRVPKYFSITPNGTNEPLVELRPVSLSITVGNDSDDIFSDGVELPITIEVKNSENIDWQGIIAGAWPTFEWVSVSSSAIAIEGIARGLELNDDDVELISNAGGRWYRFGGATGTLVVPTGVPDGDYTITARLRTPDNRNTSLDITSPEEHEWLYWEAETTITIGDPGTNVSAAELALGSEPLEATVNGAPLYVFDNPLTSADETRAETDSAAADGGAIWVELTVNNSLGNLANGGGLTSVSAIGAGGRFTIYPEAAGTPFYSVSGRPSRTAIVDSTGENSAVANPTDSVPLTGKMWIKVEKTDKKPGPVTLYAVVIGDDGSATSNSITLNFTGAPDSIALAESASSLRSVNLIEDDAAVKDTIKLELTAQDAGGGVVAPDLSGYSLRVTGPDDKPVSATNISRSQPAKGTDGKYYITLTNESGTAAAPLAPGAYTLSAKKGDLEAEVGFAVAGPTSSVVLNSESDSAGALEVITVTATLTDKDGNAVSDGTDITISASDASILAPVGVAATATKDGAASSKFAVVGTGRTIVTGESHGVVDVIVFDNSASGAAATSAVGLSCLSAHSGFATYSCDADTTAAELFALVSSRGATAIHLWNGDAWVRYSVVDGEQVPGSSDFQVITNDVLYISN